MPRVHRLRARKDYPDVNVTKGDIYFKWTTRPGGRGRGIVHRSATPPKPWQLTGSPFLQTMYQLADRLETLTKTDLNTSTRDEIAQEIRDLGEECQESLDNIPESLRYAPSGEMLQERIDACEIWANELDGIDIDDDWEELEELDEDDEDYEEKMAARDSALSELQGCAYQG